MSLRTTIRLKRALPWTAAEMIANVIYGLGIIFIIGRLITPAEFGSASIAIATILIVESFTSAGLQESIISSRSIHTARTDVAFSTAMVLSLLGMCLTTALSYPVALMTGDGKVALYIIALSTTIPLNAAEAIPMGVMMRKMRSKQIARRHIAAKAASLSVLLIGGLLEWGSWSVIAATVTVSLVSLVNVFFMLPRYPKLLLNYAVSKDLLSYGMSVSLENIFWGGMTRGFSLIFGIYHGSKALGNFQFALRFVDEIANLIRMVVIRLGLSTFSSLKREDANLASSFQTGTRLINSVSAPVFVGLAIMAPDIIHILFGDRWLVASQYATLFSISWILAMPRILVSPVLRVSGRQYIQTAYAAVSALFVICIVLVSGNKSPYWAVSAFVFRQAFAIPWGILSIKSLLNLNISKQVGILVPGLISSAIMAFAMLLLKTETVYSHSFFGIVFIFAVSISLYIAMLMLLDRYVRTLMNTLYRSRLA